MNQIPVPGTGSLDVYGIAHLAGGPSRVADAVVVALVGNDRVTVQDTGELRARDVVRRHPVEAAALDAIGVRGRHSLDTVGRRMSQDDRVADLARQLAGLGLLRRRVLVRERDGLPVWSRTAAGRRLLRQLREHPPVDHVAPGTEAMRVALHGRAAVTDPVRRARLFGVSAAGPAAPRPRRVSIDAATAAQPPAVWGLGVGGDGWGGDCGGGDGGGGGC